MNKYIDKLPAFLAEQQLMAIQAAAVPQMEDQDRKQTLRELQEIAGRDTSPQRASNQEEFVDQMAAIGIKLELPGE